jgi:hypothetical protein
MARARGRDDLDTAPKQKSDAYTGLLILSLLAQIAGAIFLFLDFSQYPESKPPKVQDRPAAVAVTPPQ